MKNLSNTDAELKKSLTYKESAQLNCYMNEGKGAYILDISWWAIKIFFLKTVLWRSGVNVENKLPSSTFEMTLVTLGDILRENVSKVASLLKNLGGKSFHWKVQKKLLLKQNLCRLDTLCPIGYTTINHLLLFFKHYIIDLQKCLSSFMEISFFFWELLLKSTFSWRGVESDVKNYQN